MAQHRSSSVQRLLLLLCLHLLFLMLLAPFHDALTVPSSSNRPPLRVFDNVLDAPTQTRLHELATASGLGHKVFAQPTNDLEHTLYQIVMAMNNTTTTVPASSSSTTSQPNQHQQPLLFIEYWCRQEWRHIEAHADIDEHLAKEQQDQPFRYPQNGHVLYLQVGTDVAGPTCLFDCTTGGQLASAAVNDDDNSPNNNNSAPPTSLYTVPAVPGRLLQFQGDLLHAVPRPTDLWLLSFVRGTPDFHPTETYGRSVILFNTWTNTPPYQVPQTDKENHHHQGDDTTECAAAAATDGGSPSSSSSSSWIRPRSEWEEVQMAELPAGKDSRLLKKIKVWLLGNEQRRQYPMRTVPLMGDPDQLREALYEKKQPRRVQLTQPTASTQPTTASTAAGRAAG